MKRIFAAYKDLVSIIYAEAPVTVVITFVCTVISGLLTPFSVYINQNVFDGGLAVAMGEMTFSDYSIYLVMFVIVAILPDAIHFH
jgi:ATP-binding cassette subfamily B protein